MCVLVVVAQCLDLSPELLDGRAVDHIDIAFDELSSEKHYIEAEDPKKFKSTKTSKTDKRLACHNY